jgi:hypothetical protein
MNTSEIAALADFFNHHHDKLLVTANAQGEPDIALMGTPRLLDNGDISFDISDAVSVSFENIKQNKAVVFMAYLPGERARDFTGARIYADVFEILTEGEKVEAIRNSIRERFGEEKAAEFQATVSCRITKVRPIVDRGQAWNEPPF